jgi:hypothetical protein
VIQTANTVFTAARIVPGPSSDQKAVVRTRMKTAIGSMSSQKRIGSRLVCSIDGIMPQPMPGNREAS